MDIFRKVIDIPALRIEELNQMINEIAPKY